MSHHRATAIFNQIRRGRFLFLALLTLGEGYHNYHHEFQYDYRNGVKPWQWDPTKWIIWTLSKLRLVRSLRRVPAEKIKSAEQQTERSHPPGEERTDPALSPGLGTPASG